ncbi:MAG: NAD(P)/FAD-dependent oxidoreductase [Leptolyngbyaceae cyanobacterium]
MRIVIIGCGVVGAAIAYELSQTPQYSITVLEKTIPAQGATGAALGIAMGVISHKVKGRNWRLREASLKRYAALLPELAAVTGQPVPHNAQGILSLCFEAADLPRWQSLQAIRQDQGWPLEIWPPAQVATACPHLRLDTVVAGIYSPQDLQIAPKALTAALIAGAQQRGVALQVASPVVGFERQGDRLEAVQTESACYEADWVIVTAGLGSADLTQQLQDLGEPLPLVPVLGQGIRVRSPQPLGLATFQPVINGDDVHLVPLGKREYGVAATVEFPEDGSVMPRPQEAALATLWQQAIAYCPPLQECEILETWYGLRPRPQGQAAPVIKPLAAGSNVILATGHYRNGVLLAPATAQAVVDLLAAESSCDKGQSSTASTTDAPAKGQSRSDHRPHQN